MSPFTRRFSARQPTPVQVRWLDGEPVEFERRPTGRGPLYRITDIRDRWEEDSAWTFPSPMPIGGDRLRCWRVVALEANQPDEPPREYVLRMRAGPGVWDLVRIPE